MLSRHLYQPRRFMRSLTSAQHAWSRCALENSHRASSHVDVSSLLASASTAKGFLKGLPIDAEGKRSIVASSVTRCAFAAEIHVTLSRRTKPVRRRGGRPLGATTPFVRDLSAPAVQRANGHLLYVVRRGPPRFELTASRSHLLSLLARAATQFERRSVLAQRRGAR